MTEKFYMIAVPSPP